MSLCIFRDSGSQLNFCFLVTCLQLFIIYLRNENNVVTTPNSSFLISIVYLIWFKCLNHDMVLSPPSGQLSTPPVNVWTIGLPPCARGISLTTSLILDRTWVVHLPVYHNRVLRLKYLNSLLFSNFCFYRIGNVRWNRRQSWKTFCESPATIVLSFQGLISKCAVSIPYGFSNKLPWIL